MLRGSRGRGLLETETPGDRDPLGTGAERCLRRRPSGTRTRAGGDERRGRHRAVSALVRAQRSGRGRAAPRFALPCPSRRSVARVTWAHLAQVGRGRRRSQLAGNAGTPRVPRSGTGRRGAGGGSCPVSALPCPALHCTALPALPGPGFVPSLPAPDPRPGPAAASRPPPGPAGPIAGCGGSPQGAGAAPGAPTQPSSSRGRPTGSGLRSSAAPCWAGGVGGAGAFPVARCGWGGWGLQSLLSG